MRVTLHLLGWIRLFAAAAFVIVLIAWGLSYWWGYSLRITAAGKKLMLSSSAGYAGIQLHSDMLINPDWALHQYTYPYPSGPIYYGLYSSERGPFGDHDWQFAGIVCAYDVIGGPTPPLWFQFDLFVPHPWLLLLLALPWAIHWLGRFRRRRSNMCARCGYDLRGSADTDACPECGERISRDPSMTKQFGTCSRGQ